MKHFKLLLVCLCLSGLFACGNDSDSTVTSGEPTPPGNPPPTSPPGEEPPVIDNTAADVKLWGRQNAIDEASAIVDTDLINAERSVAR